MAGSYSKHILLILMAQVLFLLMGKTYAQPTFYGQQLKDDEINEQSEYDSTTESFVHNVSNGSHSSFNMSAKNCVNETKDLPGKPICMYHQYY